VTGGMGRTTCGRPIHILRTLEMLVSEIILGEDDRVEWAIKAFRRKVQRSGVLKDLRKKRYFTKPSLARRLKEASARRRRKSRKRA
jgi:small subunit ribosomal protein S21